MSSLSINEDIFVSIASFRDIKCIDTLKDLYNKSDNPHNIYCGVFTQIDINKRREYCYDYNFPYNANIRRLTINYKEAKGPLWARIKIIQNLYQNEKYFFMIDAHTTFKKGWDTEFKKYINILKENKGVNKPILSGYPEDSSNTNTIQDSSYLLCNIVDGDKYPKVLSSVTKPAGYFYKSYFVAAGCFFTYGLYLKEIDIVHIAKELQHIFSGEEILLALLAYVNGWDIYSIPHSYVLHQYKTNKDKDDDNTNWYTYVDRKIEQQSYDQLEILLTSNKLDKVRKVEDFYKEIQFNPNEKTMDLKFTSQSMKRLCDNTTVIKL